MTQENISFGLYQNIVIKVGSSLIAPDGKSFSVEFCLPLASFIKKCFQQGKKVTLVSSGAVAAGYNYCKPNKKLTITDKQALASIGQAIIIQHWQKFFDNPVAQILLTADDIRAQKRAANAKNTLRRLQTLQSLPIVNENDTVAIDELKVGDNDNLGAQVAHLVNADLLIICSDVDGLFTANPHTDSNAKLIKQLDSNQLDSYMSIALGSNNPLATGGMVTKLEAAKFAGDKSIDTVICNGTNESYLSLLNNIYLGTFIRSNKNNVENQQ